jgi:hypothetical protein
MTRVKAGAAVLVLVAALAAGGAAAARTPTPAQKAAIVKAMRSEQGDVGIQKVLVSTANPSFASTNWGFANNGFSALHSSLLGMTKGEWKVLWTRDLQAPADGACVYAPATVARDLFHVSCPPPDVLHARMPTAAERNGILAGFKSSDLTPWAKTALSLSHLCISRANQSWAGGVASFESGSTVYVFFRHTKHWRPVFESLLQQTAPPPPAILLSLASCVGYNPADYNA